MRWLDIEYTRDPADSSDEELQALGAEGYELLSAEDSKKADDEESEDKSALWHEYCQLRRRQGLPYSKYSPRSRRKAAARGPGAAAEEVGSGRAAASEIAPHDV
jgi:hypothetical protein